MTEISVILEEGKEQVIGEKTNYKLDSISEMDSRVIAKDFDQNRFLKNIFDKDKNNNKSDKKT